VHSSGNESVLVETEPGEHVLLRKKQHVRILEATDSHWQNNLTESTMDASDSSGNGKHVEIIPAT
jgi:hypothetical protein